ncbi:hypothetical protein ZHAS_00012795 [Anopheles sinensis]|uniref:Uncharacterized protein n=1 Tax=Anopheles sinensis TaxID=74873 RepID=A0A084W3U1_ANOSI|nr:hypothetical protein ZHAS_00012795 [Anopheles sinensis]
MLLGGCSTECSLANYSGYSGADDGKPRLRPISSACHLTWRVEQVSDYGSNPKPSPAWLPSPAIIPCLNGSGRGREIQFKCQDGQRVGDGPHRVRPAGGSHYAEVIVRAPLIVDPSIQEGIPIQRKTKRKQIPRQSRPQRKRLAEDASARQPKWYDDAVRVT